MSNPSERKPLSLNPKKAAPLGDVIEAWWYEGRSGIDVYVQTEHGTVGCKLRRQQLKAWLAKGEKS